MLRSAVEWRPRLRASASIAGFGMLAWYARAALPRRWRVEALCGSTGRTLTHRVITVALDRGVRVVKVMGFVERRGPAGTAAALYQDLQ
jgi:hypothetical protein